MRIITDSASDITLNTLKEKNIDLIPLTVQFGDESLLDDKKTEMKDFWNIMQTTNVKTSQPAPAHFIDLFEEIKESNEEAICITVAATLSGTYSTATMAKEMVDYDKIYIIDSASATLGQAQLAYYACKLRDQGLPTLEIVKKLEAIKGKIKIYACIDTLEYLARGGRLPNAASVIGDFVKVKPIITLNQTGKIEIVKIKRGKKKAIKELQDIFNSSKIDTNFPIMPIYSCDKNNVQELMEGFSGLDDYAEIGLTIGCHIGPGAFGFIFIEK